MADRYDGYNRHCMGMSVDVIVSDLENAARNARSDMFIPLDEIFTIDELADVHERLLSFEIIKTDGHDVTPTGEMTPICGINITSNEAMSKIFGNQEIGYLSLRTQTIST